MGLNFIKALTNNLSKALKSDTKTAPPPEQNTPEAFFSQGRLRQKSKKIITYLLQCDQETKERISIMLRDGQFDDPDNAWFLTGIYYMATDIPEQYKTQEYQSILQELHVESCLWSNYYNINKLYSNYGIKENTTTIDTHDRDIVEFLDHNFDSYVADVIDKHAWGKNDPCMISRHIELLTRFISELDYCYELKDVENKLALVIKHCYELHRIYQTGIMQTKPIQPILSYFWDERSNYFYSMLDIVVDREIIKIKKLKTAKGRQSRTDKLINHIDGMFVYFDKDHRYNKVIEKINNAI